MLTESPRPIAQALPLIGGPLRLTRIRIELPSSSSNRSIRAAQLFIDNDMIPAGWESAEGLTSAAARLKLEPPRTLQTGTRLLLQVHLTSSSVLGRTWMTETIEIPVDTLIAGVSRQNLDWRKTFGDLTIRVKGSQQQGATEALIAPVIESSCSVRSMATVDSVLSVGPNDLRPTTEEILEHCPRFRILVMGKSGAGKSLLINKTFGVNDAIVADNEIGHADIVREIYSKDNPHFVLHDSKGFELGDSENVDIVKNFILERNGRESMGEKLHAIWLCIAIPTSGQPLMEIGVEEFIKKKMKNELGKVPIIVVFTKYDLLVSHVRRRMDASLFDGLEKARIDALVDNVAMDQLQERCIKPFEAKIKLFQDTILSAGAFDPSEERSNAISSIFVCSRDNHERNLSELVQLTYDCVEGYFTDAATVSAMAQRVSPVVKIKASIAVGRRDYWTRIARSLGLQGRSIRQCVDVIHADIINVWGFNDPKNYLASKEFKVLISKLVSKEEGESIVRSPHRVVSGGISLMAGLAGILSAITAAAVAVPIVLPIAAAVVFAKWVNDMYQNTTLVLERLMTYIVDLSLVLQNLFWLQAFRTPGQPITRRMIKLAVQAYAESNVKPALVFMIEKHVRDGVRLNIGADATLNRIEELLRAHIIDSADMLPQRSSLGLSLGDDARADEDWDPSTSTNDWRRLTRDDSKPTIDKRTNHATTFT